MEIGEAEIRAQLDRRIQSRALGQSESSRRLLRYFAEKTLAGEAEQLKEYTIGIDVLAKPPTYDPRDDSTVRHQVARLRQKIAEYYQEEGRRDGVFVSLPKGLYRLDFSRRRAETPERIRQQARRWRLAALVLGGAVSLCYGRVRPGHGGPATGPDVVDCRVGGSPGACSRQQPSNGDLHRNAALRALPCGGSSHSVLSLR